MNMYFLCGGDENEGVHEFPETLLKMTGTLTPPVKVLD